MNNQIDLFNNRRGITSKSVSLPGWPDHRRYPLNHTGSSVGSVIKSDIVHASQVRIVTGYASLDQIIDIANEIPTSLNKFEVLLGSEPYESSRQDFRLSRQTYLDEMREYWYERGISLRLSAKLINAISLIDKGVISARYISDSRARMHAKIYCTNEAVTLGSSNFSYNGLQSQFEANARFSKSKENKRYHEAYSIAENYWSLGDDFTAALKELLQGLMRAVDWREALVRACMELLDGDWVKQDIDQFFTQPESNLWPSQRSGIAQALWVLENVGSVLIADSTGSGKTRMGAYLLKAAMERIWGSGHRRNGMPVLTVPPMVQSSWVKETGDIGFPIRIHPHSALNTTKSERLQMGAEELKNAQLLGVDEAHNFINHSSSRTKTLLSNLADHVVLFTATPINRGPQDLLSLLNMLGADNLEDDEVSRLEKMLRRSSGYGDLDKDDLDTIRGEIKRFTVRRTKSMLNELVEREPNAYLNIYNRPCQYPRHIPRQYDTSETEKDIDVARQIIELGEQLRGIIHIGQRIELPKSYKRAGKDESEYLDSQLKAYKSLALYHLRSAMRSSKAALIEHISGTESAISILNLPQIKANNYSAGRLATLQERKGNPPENRMSISLPDWLEDADQFHAACEQEIKIYEKTLELSKSLSINRETGKANLLIKLQNSHDLILAFDHTLITLDVIKLLLSEIVPEENVHIASGSNIKGKKTVNATFRIGSSEKGHIALCSDALSEGVNLQQASAVVNLDIPSTVRFAEQRIGRVDRMDSPHDIVEAWWPRDHANFALSSDDKFIKRYRSVELLLGSNMPLPEHLHSPDTNNELEEFIEEAEKATREKPWDGIEDAFKDIRELIEGEYSIVTKEIVNELRLSRARVVSRVSVVKSERSWAFFCLSGNTKKAPKWVFFKGVSALPITRISDIAELLRENLNEDIESLPIDDRTDGAVGAYLDRLHETERFLMPKKKQKALEEMLIIIKAYQKTAAKQNDGKKVDELDSLIKLLDGGNKDIYIDWEQMADSWLTLIRPIWFDELQNRHGKRLIMLKDIRKRLLEDPLKHEDIVEAFSSISSGGSYESRIVATIIGISS